MPESDMRRLMRNIVGVSDERRLTDAMRGKVAEEWAEVERQAAAGLSPDIAAGARRAVARQVKYELSQDPIAWRDAMQPADGKKGGRTLMDQLEERCRSYDDEGEPHAVEQRDEDSLRVVLGGKLNQDLRAGYLSNDDYNAGLRELGFSELAPVAEEVSEDEQHAGDMSVEDFEAFKRSREG